MNYFSSGKYEHANISGSERGTWTVFGFGFSPPEPPEGLGLN